MSYLQVAALRERERAVQASAYPDLDREIWERPIPHGWRDRCHSGWFCRRAIVHPRRVLYLTDAEVRDRLVRIALAVRDATRSPRFGDATADAVGKWDLAHLEADWRAL